MTSPEPPRSDPHEWLLPPAPPAASQVEPDVVAQGGEPRGRRVAGAVGLLVGGALVGALAVTSLTHHSSGTPTATGNLLPAAGAGQPGLPGAPGQDGPDRQGGFPGGGPGGGGLAGEQHLQGTLTAVGASTVTVRTTTGTATYTVTATTQIVRNGQPATLADLKVGDPVGLHVYPAPSGGPLLVERLFAGPPPPYQH